MRCVADRRPEEPRPQATAAVGTPIATAPRSASATATASSPSYFSSSLANQVVDEVRRRTQQETTGHRGRKGDPLYGIRHLLLIARQRLDDRGRQRIAEALRAGDRYDEVACAWTAN